MRTDIHFKLVCAGCGQQLEVDGKSDDNAINFHSARNAEEVSDDR